MKIGDLFLNNPNSGEYKRIGATPMGFVECRDFSPNYTIFTSTNLYLDQVIQAEFGIHFLIREMLDENR